MESFADRLASAVRAKRSPVVVGLDPRWPSLPEPLTRGVAAGDLAGMAAATEKFCAGIIDAVAPHVPAVKPQAAFYECLGPPGMQALFNVIRHARARGLLVILDGKRNDIGSTAEGYADAYLGADSPWQADALTVSPYLGDDSLTPFVSRCQAAAAGIFVLVKTSNPGGKTIQDLRADGRAVYQHVAGIVEQLAHGTRGKSGYGDVGAVVGATYPEQLSELRSLMPSAWLLIPGYGSQGGTAADVRGGFDANALGAVVNNSRGIIFAHSSKQFAQSHGSARWQEAAETATREMLEQLRLHTPAGRL